MFEVLQPLEGRGQPLIDQPLLVVAVRDCHHVGGPRQGIDVDQRILELAPDLGVVPLLLDTLWILASVGQLGGFLLGLRLLGRASNLFGSSPHTHSAA